MNQKKIALFFTLLILLVTLDIFASEMHNKDVQWGDDEESLVRKYGSPEHYFINPRHDFVGIYYGGIERTYPSNNPEFKDVPIKEMFWNVNKDLNLTCWLHYKNGKWIVISRVYWPPGSKF